MIRKYKSVILQIKMKTAINSSLSLFWELNAGGWDFSQKTDMVLMMQSFIFHLASSLFPSYIPT